MARQCSVCVHPDVDGINAALLAGTPLRQIVSQTGTSTGSLRRHKNHMPTVAVHAREASIVASADSLLLKIETYMSKAESILAAAESAGQLPVAIQALREARSCVELLARLRGELQTGTTVNVLVSPQWAAVRTAILSALLPYPDARVAAAAALEGRQ